MVTVESRVLALPNDCLGEIGIRSTDLVSLVALAATCRGLFNRAIFLLLMNPELLSKYLTRAVLQEDQSMVKRTFASLDAATPIATSVSLRLNKLFPQLPHAIAGLHQRFSRLFLDFCSSTLTHSALETYLGACTSLRGVTVRAPLTNITYSKLSIPDTLEVLHIDAEGLLENEFLTIFKRLPKLKTFELNVLHTNILPPQGYEVAEWPSTLQRVALSRSQIARAGLEKIFSSSPNLKELVLRGATWLHPESFHDLAFPESLEVLELEGLQIDDRGFLQTLERCTKLKRLVLSHCPLITSDAFSMAPYAKSLQVADFTDTQFSDDGLHKLCSSSQELTHIHVPTCPNITLEGIIAAQFPPKLEQIEGFFQLLGNHDWFTIYVASEIFQGVASFFAKGYACMNSPRKMQLKKSAFLHLERSIFLAPRFVLSLVTLGKLLVQKTNSSADKTRGRQLLERALVLDPTNSEALALCKKLYASRAKALTAR